MLCAFISCAVVLSSLDIVLGGSILFQPFSILSGVYSCATVQVASISLECLVDYNYLYG